MGIRDRIVKRLGGVAPHEHDKVVGELANAHNSLLLQDARYRNAMQQMAFLDEQLTNLRRAYREITEGRGQA